MTGRAVAAMAGMVRDVPAVERAGRLDPYHLQSGAAGGAFGALGLGAPLRRAPGRVTTATSSQTTRVSSTNTESGAVVGRPDVPDLPAGAVDRGAVSGVLAPGFVDVDGRTGDVRDEPFGQPWARLPHERHPAHRLRPSHRRTPRRGVVTGGGWRRS
jgi:hypothetical protein